VIAIETPAEPCVICDEIDVWTHDSGFGDVCDKPELWTTRDGESVWMHWQCAKDADL